MSKKIPRWVTTVLWVAVIVLTAYFIGQSASLYLRSRLQAPRSITLAKEKNQKKAEKKPLSFYEKEIVSTLGEGKKPKAAPTAIAPSPGSRNNPAATPKKEPEVDWDRILADPDPPVSLSGTVIGGDVAVAFVNVDGKDLTLSIGQPAGTFRLAAINKNTITFRKGATARTVMMDLEQNRGVRRSKARRRFQPRSYNKSRNTSLKGMIKYQGGKRIIDRRRFNALLKPPSRLANELKFIPNSKDGKPYGIRISYLKPGSFFSRIGMRSGDILVKTNKKELKSVEDSFYAYQAFRNEDHITLEIDRRGKILKIPMEFR